VRHEGAHSLNCVPFASARALKHVMDVQSEDHRLAINKALATLETNLHVHLLAGGSGGRVSVGIRGQRNSA
jgi:hypothetical protein